MENTTARRYAVTENDIIQLNGFELKIIKYVESGYNLNLRDNNGRQFTFKLNDDAGLELFNIFSLIESKGENL